ncbi:hypothetical protein BsWGS_24409 [Bradybaena similaris]
MAQHGRGRPDAMNSYSSSEIYRASHELKKDIARGPLQFLQAAFEYYPLEAVPNVWEGDEGMMEHVPQFPMPPCVALPELPDSDAVYSTSRIGSTFGVHHSGGRTGPLPETPEAHGEIAFEDYGLQKKKPVMERKFWIHMAKVNGSLYALSLSLERVSSRLTNHQENVRKKAAQQLADVYSTMRKIKMCIQRAEVRYTRYGFSNLFQVMSVSKKLAFQNQHHLKGKLPVNLGSVEKKYLDVRDKMGKIVQRNWENLSPFQDIANTVMKDVRTRCNLFRDNIFQCLDGVADDDAADGEETAMHRVSGGNAESDMLHSDEESQEIKTENVADTGALNGLSKEDLFWENMTTMKIRMQKIARTLQVLDNMDVQSTSVKVISRTGSAICRQMLFSKKGIMIFEKILNKLKKEMEAENYEDKKLFSEENISSLGIEGLTPDNSLMVIETWLKKLKDEYFKIRNEKSAILERFGYDAQVGFEHPQIDSKMKLVRICAHSKSVISAYNFVRVKKGSPVANQKEAGEESVHATSSLGAGTSSQQHAEADSDHHSKNPIVRETTSGDRADSADISISENISQDRNEAGGDSTPAGAAAADEDDDDASDESSPNDISKTVNTMSFFLSSFGTSALTVKEESFSAPVSEEFIENEKDFWDKLQKLLQKIDKTFRQLNAKSKRRFFGQKHMRSVLQPLHMRMKDLLKNFESENEECRRCGYCRQVTYENEEQLPEGYSYVLVKSLDQIRNRIDTVWGHYIAAAKRLGMPFSYKL